MGALIAQPPYSVNDGGQAGSRRFAHLSGVCTARALAIAGRIPFDLCIEALEGFEGDSLTGGDQGMEFGRWARKVGHLTWWSYDATMPQRSEDVTALAQRTMYLQWTPFHALKGSPRIRAYDLPKLIPKGRFIASSEVHVEAWLDGVHHDRPGIWEEIKRDRVIYGIWQARELQPLETLYRVSKVWAHHGQAHKSDLGLVAGADLEHAYHLAAESFEGKVKSRKMDLLVEEVYTAQ